MYRTAAHAWTHAKALVRLHELAANCTQEHPRRLYLVESIAAGK
jgi:hypothetical protein